MGDWLSSRGNRRAQNGFFPDENYAREVMQLFTIGLYLLNDDGTQQTDVQGPIPTYDADKIREYAEASANGEIDAALDGLLNHQSCPPYLSRLLIQRFVKSNPSRAYLGRVVAKFKNNGQGVRGDLKAVLLDPEAWPPIRVQYQRAPVSKFVVTTMGTEDSRLQEPVLKYTRFTRFFKGVGTYEKGTGGNVPNFLVEVGGWDHHASLLDNQDDMIPAIDNGLKAFYDFLVAESLLSKVTLFSISDFGRTLSFNGSGTDHAWGGNPIVMGGSVQGGRIYGTYPNIVLDTSGTGIDRGRGV